MQEKELFPLIEKDCETIQAYLVRRASAYISSTAAAV
jgi:hypothetical protein